MKKSLKMIAVAALLLGVAGCARPQYETRMVPLGSPHATDAEQAESICRPQAEMAAANVRDNAQKEENYRAAQTTEGAYLDTGALSLGYETTKAVNRAYSSAFNSAFESCLAQYGWRLERHCVQNCR